MTETEWRAYLRSEIERLLDAAGERELRLTLKFLRTAARWACPCGGIRRPSGTATTACPPSSAARRRSWCPAWRSRRGSALPAHMSWGTLSSATSAGMTSCAESRSRVTTPSSRRPMCSRRVCLPRPVCSGAAACGLPRTSSGCATSAERLPTSAGAGCRSFTGGSAF